MSAAWRALVMIVTAVLLVACKPSVQPPPPPAESSAPSQKANVDAVRQAMGGQFSVDTGARLAVLRAKGLVLGVGDPAEAMYEQFKAKEKAQAHYTTMLGLLESKPAVHAAMKKEYVAYLNLLEQASPKDGELRRVWEARSDRAVNDLTAAQSAREVEMDLAFPSLRAPARQISKEQFEREVNDAAQQALDAAKQDD